MTLIEQIDAEYDKADALSGRCDIPRDTLLGWKNEATQLGAEIERLQSLVDLDHTYGHLYLVAMRKLKDHSEELYWELFATVLAHFDALLTIEGPDRS